MQVNKNALQIYVGFCIVQILQFLTISGIGVAIISVIVYRSHRADVTIILPVYTRYSPRVINAYLYITLVHDKAE